MRPRRRQHQSLEDYDFERINQFHQLGAIVERPGTIYLGTWRVVVQTLLIFGQEQQAHLWVYEVVELQDGSPTRRKYQYHLDYAGGLAFRYDRDPTQHPDMPDHKHLGPDNRRMPGDVSPSRKSSTTWWNSWPIARPNMQPSTSLYRHSH